MPSSSVPMDTVAAAPAKASINVINVLSTTSSQKNPQPSSSGMRNEMKSMDDDLSKVDMDYVNRPNDSSSVESLQDAAIELDNEPQGKWHNAGFHLMAAMVGTGVLGLPKAMSQLGWAAGLILLALATAASYYNAALLSLMHLTKKDPNVPGGRHRLTTYYAIAEHVLGPKLSKWIVSPCQYIVLVGTCIAYLIAGGESISFIYESNCGNHCTPMRKLVWTSIFAAIELVLSFFPSLESVSSISVVATVASMVYCVIAVSLCFYVGRRPDVSYSVGGGTNGGKFAFDFFTGLSTMAFSFGVHAIVPEVQTTLKTFPDPRRENIKGVSLAWGFALVLYFLSAGAGFWVFGTSVDGNILSSLQRVGGHDQGLNIAVTIAETLVLLHVLIAYQVWSMPVYDAVQKRVLAMKFMRRDKDVKSNEVDAEDLPSRHTVRSSLGLRVICRFSYIIATWFVAIAIPFFSDIMSLFGAVGVTPLTFIIPAYMFILYKGNSINMIPRLSCWSIVICGLIILAVGTIASIRQIALHASTYRAFA